MTSLTGSAHRTKRLSLGQTEAAHTAHSKVGTQALRAQVREAGWLIALVLFAVGIAFTTSPDWHWNFVGGGVGGVGLFVGVFWSAWKFPPNE